MGFPLPAPTTVNVSDAAKVGLAKLYDTGLSDGVRCYKLLPQLSFLDNFDDNSLDTVNWLKADSGSNINEQNGRLEMNGGGAWNTNGLVRKIGHTARGNGFMLEVTATWLTAVSHYAYFLQGQANAAALSYATTTDIQVWINSGGPYIQKVNNTSGGSDASVKLNLLTHDVAYTFRKYLLADGSSRVTVQGGAYSAETQIGAGYTGDLPATYYPNFQLSSASANLLVITHYAEYLILPTDGPTVERIYDAGAGGVFKNLDFTNVVQFGSLVSTNLKYIYSFDDGVADYSAALTLAQLNAVGKIIANHRYIRIKTQINSDGATQAYDAGLYAASVIDAAGPLSSGGGGSNFNGGMN